MNLSFGNSGDVQIKGWNEFERNLRQKAGELSDEEMDDAMYQVAVEMSGKMQARAHPAIKKVIVAKRFSRKMKDISSAFVTIDRKIKDAMGRMMGNMASWFEYGTGPRYRKRMKGSGSIGRTLKLLTGKFGFTGHMPKMPFFRPTVNEYNGGLLMQRLASIVKSKIERRSFNDMWGSGGV